jgi:hypothetical protein
MGALGATMTLPQYFSSEGFVKKANAATAINEANVVFPVNRPQVINIFMYGGPSELAGNLTNIADINANSQNSYNDYILTRQDHGQSGQTGAITPNGFWGSQRDGTGAIINNARSAGGDEMEAMLAAGDMSVYRTINRIKDNTRAHRPSINSSQKGSLDIEASGGMGTKIAAVLANNQDAFAAAYGKAVQDLILPFVSFEGTSTALADDSSIQLPTLNLKAISLNTNLGNPYRRSGDVFDDDNDPDTPMIKRQIAIDIDNLVEQISPSNRTDRYNKVVDQFNNRKQLAGLIDAFEAKLDVRPVIPFGADAGPNNEFATGQAVPDGSTVRVEYPDNPFSERLKAALTLALNNPDTLFIAVGTGGLGGWDDHENAIQKYEDRMTSLMKALRAAMLHIKYADMDSGSPDKGLISGLSRKTDNIVINIHGDFGRNVNLNGSMGWDHGNNQNLYTLGGSAVRQELFGQNTLGKVVGTTRRIGDTGKNRQFTDPEDTSYQAEPMSIASTVYAYFGVQNPEVLTKDSIMNPAGDPMIDETVAGEPPL